MSPPDFSSMPSSDYDPDFGIQEPDHYELLERGDHFPSKMSYISTIYVNKLRIGRDFELAVVLEDYARLYPGRQFFTKLIAPDDLKFSRISSWPLAEREFNRRGYVSEFEFRFAKRGNQFESRFVRENYKAMDSSASILGAMLDTVGDQFFCWHLKFADTDWRSHEYRCFIDSQVLKCIGQISGRESLREVDSLYGSPIERKTDASGEMLWRDDYKLVEFEGLLLGCSNTQTHNRIHLAEASTPLSSLRRSRTDSCHDSLFGHNTGKVQEQVNFELTPDATQAFFADRHWRQMRNDMGANAAPIVKPEMVLTWFSQVLAALRKATWRAKIMEHPLVARDALRREAETLRGGAGTLPTPLGAMHPPYGRAAETLAERIELMTNAYAHEMYIRNNDWIAADHFKPTMTEDQLLIARLHGATLNTLSDEVSSDPQEFLASWIGRLKREGRNTMRKRIASDLLEIEHLRHFGFKSFFYDLFSDEVWDALFDVATSAIKSGESVEVYYVWSRDLQFPWSIRERSINNLVVCGPLLSFPASNARYWSEKTEIVREIGGFSVPSNR